MTSAAFFSLFLIFFCAGLRFGQKQAGQYARRRVFLSECWKGRNHARTLLNLIKRPCTFLVLSGVAFQVLHTGLILVGQAHEFDFGQVVYLRRSYGGASIQGITILKFMSLPGFVLATIGRVLAKKWHLPATAKKFRNLQLMSLAVPIFSAMLGSRSKAMMWLIPYFYLQMGFAYRLQNIRLPLVKLAKGAVAVTLVFGVLYSTGYYLRHYSRVQVCEVHEREYSRDADSFFEKTFLTFLSYPFRTINNGLVVVDHFEKHSYLWRTFRWLYSGLGIEGIDPGGYIRAVKENMLRLDHLGLSYFGATNASLPGYLFIDMGWFALVGALMLGLVVGLFYRLWQNTAFLAWVVTPIMIAPLLDSWRTDIFFKSVNMSCLFTAIAVGLYIEKQCRHVWYRASKARHFTTAPGHLK